MTLAGRPRHALRTGLVAALVALVAPRPVTLDPRMTGNDELAERLRHMTGGTATWAWPSGWSTAQPCRPPESA
jgi:hypothetical protein